MSFSTNLVFCKNSVVLVIVLNLLLMPCIRTSILRDSLIGHNSHLNLKTSNKEKLLERSKRSDEFEPITDPDLLAKQYALVHKFRSIDILGAIHQYPSGKIDTRDFGQNIHFGYRDRIRPGEKERALQNLMNQAIEGLIRIAKQFIEDTI